MTFKSYKYRIYPNKEQEIYLNRNFGAVRLVWNQMVANFNSWSKDGPNRPMNEKILKDNDEFDWLNECISYALQQKANDFIEFRNQYFSKSRKSKLGRPKFKKKGVSRDSFRIPGQFCSNKHINFDVKTIKLPKMTPIKMVAHREFTNIIKNVTVSKNKCNQYFVSILVEEELKLKQNTGRSIGVDLGLKDLCITSSGIIIGNPRWFRETQSKLKRAQQHFSRKVKNSNHREKCRLKVAKLYQKITNQRQFILHNISAWLVDNYNLIVMEDLNVSGMIKNHKLAKSIQDASWSTLVTMIEYKSNWYGRTFHKIDRFYSSSKTCSCCDYKLDSLTLDVREWICPECNTKHDRDLNAARNILGKGLVDLYNLTSDELADYRRGELLNPEVINLPKVDSLKRLTSFIK